MQKQRTIFGLLMIAFISYSFFVYTVGTEEEPKYNMTDDIVQGKLLFQKHNCIACHQLYGLGGYIGPDLTTVISKRCDDYSRAFIKNGSVRMPNFKFNDKEVDCLIAYLKYVDATAVTYR